MNRRQWYFGFFVLALAVRVHQYINGTAEHGIVFLEPLLTAWVAFVFPAAPIVIMAERYVFHLDPWAHGHSRLSALLLTLTASAIWFVPWSRLGTYVARWFATFTASQGEKSHVEP